MNLLTFIFGAGNYGGSFQEEMRPKKQGFWGKLLNLFKHGKVHA